MQLSVNLFKKEKWGLLAKSINLYEQKYGVDSNHESNEYLKANALLRKNIKEKNKGVQAAANNILNSLLESTQNYDLRKAVGRYLIQEALDRGDYINSLGLSRKLFFESKKEFDKELTIYTSTIILHSLAELKQNEKINDFLADKYINKILPSQIGLAYNSYALLVRGDNTEVIRNYEKNMKGLVKPLHPAILFNTAEAYFRESKFDESIALFDEFVKEYSHIREAGQARLRIALAYEVSNKSIQKVTTLYKDAIDRAQSAKVRYEAKLRYLGVVLNRKIELTTEDNEKTIFFEMTPDERVAIDDELKKLLWLVRLRTYINQSQYQKALTYLVSIPLNSLKPTKRRAFQADGAEIIYGLLKQAYNNENYSRVVKLWETYKITYDKNVAMNPHANFVVASSYLKLGLHKSFDRVLSNFKELESYTTRIYPKWVNRGKEIKIANMLKELLIVRHIEDNDWKVADKMLETLSSNDRKDINYSYYRGSIDYALKNYEKAANNFEHMLVNQNKKNLLDLSQLGNLLVKYIEALHQTNQKERLINTAAAILKDISSAKTNNASLASAQERIHYLLIENFYASKNTAFPKLEKESKKFLKEFSKSNYKDRVKYLYGLAMIKNLKVEQGSEILNSLISDKEVPGYLKEMAKTELSAVKIGVGI